MKLRKLLILITVILAYLPGTIYAVPVEVNSLELWDGGVMHGITPPGDGSSGDPYVYLIPQWMTITSSGAIKTNDMYVTFIFSSGPAGLDMQSGGYQVCAER